MITELGKLYKPVTTLPEEDDVYLTIITIDGVNKPVNQSFSNGSWTVPGVRAWMPIPPVPDNFFETCFLNVGSELELQEGETGSLVVHPPTGEEGASIELVVTVADDIVVDGKETACVVVHLKAYLSEAGIAIGEPTMMPFEVAKRVLDAEFKAKTKYGVVDPEAVLSILKEQHELEEAQQKLVQDVFEETDAD